MDGYDNGGTLPPGGTQIVNSPDIKPSLLASHAYIHTYGPGQILSPEQTAVLRKRFEEQS